jgi:hypothetical protein
MPWCSATAYAELAIDLLTKFKYCIVGLMAEVSAIGVHWLVLSQEVTMNDEIKAHLEHLFALVGESFNRIEVILMSDGCRESKLSIREEIAALKDSLKAALPFLK